MSWRRAYRSCRPLRPRNGENCFPMSRPRPSRRARSGSGSKCGGGCCSDTFAFGSGSIAAHIAERDPARPGRRPARRAGPHAARHHCRRQIPPVTAHPVPARDLGQSRSRLPLRSSRSRPRSHRASPATHAGGGDEAAAHPLAALAVVAVLATSGTVEPKGEHVGSIARRDVDDENFIDIAGRVYRVRKAGADPS